MVAAMTTVQALLSPSAQATLRTVILRDPKPGDIGWVVQQHDEIHAREYR